jgi:hypothetical protein
MTDVSVKPSSGNILLDIIDRIQACQTNRSACDLNRLKYDFVAYMTTALGGKYSFTYGSGLSSLFDIMVTPPGDADIARNIYVIGGLLANYVVNMAMSIISGIPAVGEIDAVYVAARQAITMAPIIQRLSVMFPINIKENLLSIYNSNNTSGLMTTYINSAIDTLVKSNNLPPDKVEQLKASALQFTNSISDLYKEMKNKPIAKGGRSNRRTKRRLKKKQNRSYIKRRKHTRKYIHKYL